MKELTKTVLYVPEMACSHCEENVKKTLSQIKFVESVEVDLGTKKVTVTHGDLADTRAMIDALDDAGYDAEVI